VIKFNFLIDRFSKIYFYFFFKKKITSRGLNFYLFTENWITRFRARTFNTKEVDTLDWIDANIKKNDNFFDIGSNIGIYSLYASKRKAECKIYSFEPEYSNLDQLKKNILINKVFNIYPYSIAFSENTGLSYLNLQDITPGSALHTESSLDIDKTLSSRDIVFKEGVATYKIDDFVLLTNIFPNLMKIDVDGNEINVLKGAMNTLKNNKLRSIILELDFKDKAKEIKYILSTSGFHFVSSDKDNQIWSKYE
jgi:FkbM family methyltransferase